MSQQPLKLRADVRVPKDSIYATREDGYIIGGMRYDDEDGWKAYWPEEARGMALLLGHCDETYHLFPDWKDRR